MCADSYTYLKGFILKLLPSAQSVHYHSTITTFQLFLDLDNSRGFFVVHFYVFFLLFLTYFNLLIMTQMGNYSWTVDFGVIMNPHMLWGCCDFKQAANDIKKLVEKYKGLITQTFITKLFRTLFLDSLCSHESQILTQICSFHQISAINFSIPNRFILSTNLDNQ